jgi:hypothetical protein
MTLSLYLSLSHTYTHTHSHILTSHPHTHTHTHSLILSLSHTHKHTHTHTRTHTHTHIHTHSHTGHPGDAIAVRAMRAPADVRATLRHHSRRPRHGRSLCSSLACCTLSCDASGSFSKQSPRFLRSRIALNSRPSSLRRSVFHVCRGHHSYNERVKYSRLITSSGKYHLYVAVAFARTTASDVRATAPSPSCTPLEVFILACS